MDKNILRTNLVISAAFIAGAIAYNAYINKRIKRDLQRTREMSNEAVGRMNETINKIQNNNL